VFAARFVPLWSLASSSADELAEALAALGVEVETVGGLGEDQTVPPESDRCGEELTKVAVDLGHVVGVHREETEVA
jgi:hypothetical protein